MQRTLDAYRPLFEALATRCRAGCTSPWRRRAGRSRPRRPDGDDARRHDAGVQPDDARHDGRFAARPPRAGARSASTTCRSRGRRATSSLIVLGNRRRVRPRVEPPDGRPAPVGVRARGRPPRGARRAARARPARVVAQRVRRRLRARPDALERRARRPRPRPTRTALRRRCQELLGDPEVLLGAMQSQAQRALLPQLEALVARHRRLRRPRHGRRSATASSASYGMVTEALRRRRVEADRPTASSSSCSASSSPRRTYDRGAAFVDGVVERAGTDGLERLWRRRARAADARRGRRPRPLARPHRPAERRVRVNPENGRSGRSEAGGRACGRAGSDRQRWRAHTGAPRPA